MLRPKADLLPQTHDKDTIPTNSLIKTHYTHHTHKPIEISKNQNLPYPQKKEKKEKEKEEAKTRNIFLNFENLVYSLFSTLLFLQMRFSTLASSNLF